MELPEYNCFKNCCSHSRSNPGGSINSCSSGHAADLDFLKIGGRVKDGFFFPHTSHLFPCPPTDGAARIFISNFIYLLNTLEHHFNVSGSNSFFLTPIPEREKNHLKRQFFLLAADRGDRTPVSSVASKCAIHYNIASRVLF